MSTLSSAIDRNAAFGCAYSPLSAQRNTGSHLVVTGRDMSVLRLEYPQSSGWRCGEYSAMRWVVGDAPRHRAEDRRCQCICRPDYYRHCVFGFPWHGTQRPVGSRGYEHLFYAAFLLVCAV